MTAGPGRASNIQNGWFPPGASMFTRRRDPALITWAKGNSATLTGVIWPGTSAWASASWWVWNGTSSVERAGSSARWLARSQPDWMNISSPSGRTSVRVTSMSVSVSVEAIHRSTEPRPA